MAVLALPQWICSCTLPAPRSCTYLRRRGNVKFVKQTTLAILLLVSAVGCSAPSSSGQQSKVSETPNYTAYYTYPNASGNRYLPNASMNLLADSTGVAKADLPGVPIWLVSVSIDETVAWVVSLQDGTLLAFRWDQGKLLSLDLPVESLRPGMPPTVVVSGSGEISIANTLVGDMGPPPHRHLSGAIRCVSPMSTTNASSSSGKRMAVRSRCP